MTLGLRSECAVCWLQQTPMTLMCRGFYENEWMNFTPMRLIYSADLKNCQLLKVHFAVQDKRPKLDLPLSVVVMLICVPRERPVWCWAIWSVHLWGSRLPPRHSVQAGWDAGERLCAWKSRGELRTPSAPGCLSIRFSYLRTHISLYA